MLKTKIFLICKHLWNLICKDYLVIIVSFSEIYGTCKSLFIIFIQKIQILFISGFIYKNKESQKQAAALPFYYKTRPLRKQFPGRYARFFVVGYITPLELLIPKNGIAALLNLHATINTTIRHKKKGYCEGIVKQNIAFSSYDIKQYLFSKNP